MKRYRVLSFDFDSRALLLEPAGEHWIQEAKDLHRENQKSIIRELGQEFGTQNLEQKLNSVIELGPKPFSVHAYHNKFLEQVRKSYTCGSYYPALTGACALGERILNHLMLKLRDFHKSSPAYKKIFRKKSFDNWPDAIDALEEWEELLPDAADKFRVLNGKRNSAIHFNPETDHNDQELALDAIHLLQDIVRIQFSFGTQPWFFCFDGEIYLKQEWESKPFVQVVIIPYAHLVGPRHRMELKGSTFYSIDEDAYEDSIISDEEFADLRRENAPKLS